MVEAGIQVNETEGSADDGCWDAVTGVTRA